MPRESQHNLENRRMKILDILAVCGMADVQSLSAELRVTPATIRSDLDALEQAGHLFRTRGGAVTRGLYKTQRERDPDSQRVKRAVAAAACALVRNNETLFINSGITTLHLAAALKQRANLKIVTNSIEVAVALTDHPGFRVVLLGGELNVQHNFMYGTDAQTQLRLYQADRALLSIDGISAKGGLSTHHADEAMIDRLMMERAGETMILATHDKLKTKGFYTLGELTQAHTLVTDAGADWGLRKEIEAKGVRVVVQPV